MDNGRFAAMWYQFPDGFQSDVPNRTKVRVFGSDGSPVSGEIVTPDVFTKGVACEGPGNEFLVVYRDGLFFGQRMDDSGQLLGTAFEIRASSPYGDLSRPDCCGGDSGFVVVWEEYESGNGYEILGRQLASDGASVGDSFRVNSYTTGYQRHADIDCNDDGSFVVVWATEKGYYSPAPDGDGVGIGGRRFQDAATPAGNDFIVNEVTEGDQRYPSVATDASGNFMVVWRSHVAYVGTSIQAQAFASGGARIGTEFVAHTTSFDEQRYAAVGARSVGEFIVAWDAVDSGFNEHDVRAQRISLGITQTTTTTTTTTTTMSSGGICADPIALTHGEPPPPPGRVVTATDALFVLRAAVGSETCQLCVCDVNGSGGVTASDALVTLSAAVGQPVSLMCPPCS
jgi:hypothetical protein